MAGRGRLLQTNFGGGEISRASRARPDTDIYAGALEACRNFLVRPSGAIDRRGGSVYLGAAKNANAGKRWFVFQKAINDVVRIEAGDGVFRFWSGTTRALITSGGSPVEVSIPWSNDELQGLRVWQQGDVMWFAHTSHDYQTRALKRTATNAFTLSLVELEEGPFNDLQANQAALTFSNVTGAVTVTGAAGFKPEHVGSLLRIEAASQPDVAGWAFDQKTLVGEYCRNGNRFYYCTDNGTEHLTGNAPPIHESGIERDGSISDNCSWRFEGYTYGLMKITGWTSASQVQATVLQRLPFYGAASKTTAHWQISAISEDEGWPACGTLIEDRFALFGTATDPDRCFLSRTSRYTPDSADMRPGFVTETLDDDAVRRSIAEGQTSYIVWSIFMDQLLLGTTRGVRSLVGPSQDEALTPAGAVPRTVSEVACSPNVPPIKADNALIYLAVGDQELIEISRLNDSVPRNLLEMAAHMSGAGIRSTWWQGRPRRVLWCVDFTGRLVSLTYSPENGTIAWARHRLGGALGRKQPFIDDVCCAPGPDGQDEAWLIVARTINGSTVRTVEYFERPYDPNTMRAEAACCVDMSQHYDLWQSYTALAEDIGGGSVRLTAQGATPFVSGDVGREFWLTANEAYPDEDDDPSPVKVTITARNSSTVLIASIGAYPSEYWDGQILRVARPANQFSGLSWCEGESVMVNADGRRFGPYTVSGGSINLLQPGAGDEPAWSARGWIGLAYPSKARSLPVNGAEGLGSSRSAVGRVTEMAVLPVGITEGRVSRSDGLPDRAVDLNPRTSSHKLGAPVPDLTEDQFIPLDTGFDRQKQIEIDADGPLPCSLAGFVLKVESYG